MYAVCISARTVVWLVCEPFGVGEGGVLVFAFIPNKRTFTELIGEAYPGRCTCDACDCCVDFFIGDGDEVGTNEGAGCCSIAPRESCFEAHIAAISFDLLGVTEDTLSFTGSVTPVTVVVVFVVTLFDTCLDDTIATGGFFAAVEAGVVVVFVAIITFFAGLNDTIATDCDFAGFGAKIIVFGVAVITFLDAFVEFSIATGGFFAAVETSVVVVFVAVVTFFASLDEAVTTSGFDTGV